MQWIGDGVTPNADESGHEFSPEGRQPEDDGWAERAEMMENDQLEGRLRHRWGGARPGAGRKARPVPLLDTHDLDDIKDAVEYAMALLSAMMRDESLDLRLRFEASKELMDRIKGKPAQVTRSSDKDEFRQYLEDLEEALRCPDSEQPSAGGESGQADGGDLIDSDVDDPLPP